MESLIQSWDGELVVVRHDAVTGAWMFIAIHSTRLGPADGGTRLLAYASAIDALRLAEGMTLKYAIASFSRGGGKAVIAVPGVMEADARNGLLRRHGELVGKLGGLFRTGPDVGTSAEDMDEIARAAGPYVDGRTSRPSGRVDTAALTAIGVWVALQVVCGEIFGSPSVAGRSFLVQGFGKVGEALVGRLRLAGARILVSDTDPQRLRRAMNLPGVGAIAAERVYETECDVFVPCALGGVLNGRTIPRLRCHAVAGAANNQLGAACDADLLHARNILYAPDYVINLGGAIGGTGVEHMGWSLAQAEREITDTVHRTLTGVFAAALAANGSPDRAARRLAEERLQQADSSRAAGPRTMIHHGR